MIAIWSNEDCMRVISEYAYFLAKRTDSFRNLLNYYYRNFEGSYESLLGKIILQNDYRGKSSPQYKPTDKIYQYVDEDWNKILSGRSKFA